MSSITADVATAADNMVNEVFSFIGLIILNYWQEILLILFLAGLVGIVWKLAKRFVAGR